MEKIQRWRLALRWAKGFLTYNIQECSLIMLNGISNSNQKPQGPILARLLSTKNLMVHLCMPVLCSTPTSHCWNQMWAQRFSTAVKTKNQTTNQAELFLQMAHYFCVLKGKYLERCCLCLDSTSSQWWQSPCWRNNRECTSTLVRG